ncbi:MAG: glycosyltransferase family 2 protein [Clostridia bacterium]|nr:glycosyltransferase family 2 protein [Clostridia bacterium]
MISVIVPVFNVEPYLSRCLDSLLAQDLRDIEIIVVDDGSTDGSPAICDAYRDCDARIRVFHTQNRGLSAARNLGIGNARGEWVMFVDSDDWVEPGFCQTPYRAAVESGADLVIFGFTVFKEDGRIDTKGFRMEAPVPPQAAVEFGINAAWNKLYRRALFDGIRYPEGRLFEDALTTYRLVYRAHRIAALDAPLYNYKKRQKSISTTCDERSCREKLLAAFERYDGLLSLGYPPEKLERGLLFDALHYLMRTEPDGTALYARAGGIVSACQGIPDGLKPVERNAIKLWRLNETLFHRYCRDMGLKVAPPERSHRQ